MKWTNKKIITLLKKLNSRLKCSNHCDYVKPYGFVIEAGCKIHDR